MSTLSEIGEAAQALHEAVAQIQPAILNLCVKGSDVLREGEELLNKADRVADNAACAIGILEAKVDALLNKLTAIAESLPLLEAAVQQTIEKASRKLDGIPDHLFPLTIQAPGPQKAGD